MDCIYEKGGIIVRLSSDVYDKPSFCWEMVNLPGNLFSAPHWKLQPKPYTNLE